MESGLSSVVLFCAAAQTLATGTVGLRLLLLARRTRQAPELLMGVALVTMNLLGYPLLLAGGVAGAVRELNLPLFALGSLLVDGGALAFGGFVACVFRPGAGWARGVVACVGLFLALHLVLSTLALFHAPADALAFEHLGWRGALLTGAMTVVFCWGAAEAVPYYLRLRRQLALGLTTRDVAQRFLWFAASCVVPVFMMIAVGAGLAAKRSPMTDPTLALLISVASATVGVAMWLAFLPPRFYRAWLGEGA